MAKPILCGRGKPPTDTDLAAVEAFADWLRDAGPRRDDQPDRDQHNQPEQRMDQKPEDRSQRDDEQHDQH